MRNKKSILALLAAGCCLLFGSLTSLTVRAAAAEPAPRAVFVNEERNSPDLCVRKKLEGVETVSPDLKFSFILKLDGKLAKELEYSVWDAKGNPVYKTDSSGNRIPWMTGHSGEFQLRPDEMAVFSYVGPGVTYEVTEVPTEGWRQVKPLGGASAVGTVTKKGALAEFVNSPDKAEKGLRIQKTISFPEGYAPPETPEFTFTVQVQGKPLALEKYAVWNDASGTVEGEKWTDSEGRLKLRGGQTAVFERIPADKDYEIREELLDGWYLTGEEVRKGTTGDRGAVFESFHNTNAAFAVTKELEEAESQDTEKEFTFLLTDGERKVLKNAPFYLYLASGEPVLDEKGSPVVRSTDEKGEFRLKAGETAIFTGIKPGTAYNVSEKAEPGYVQTIPGSAWGYTDKTVSESAELLVFVNRRIQGGLQVTKQIENTGDDAPLEQREFTFRLSRKTTAIDPDGNPVYEPVKQALYCVETGTAQFTYRTDENGDFTLKANETARFTHLEMGSYRVEEINSGPEYTPKETVLKGELTGDKEGLQFSFVNAYDSRVFGLCLHKEDRLGSKLGGAKFILCTDKELKNEIPGGPFVSDQDGSLIIEGLKPGTYYLKEIRSPEGYQLLVNPIEITVTWTADNVMQAKVNGKSVTSQEDTDQIYIRLREETGETDQVHIRIYNSRFFTLPATGGLGIYTTAGLFLGILILLAVVWRLTRKNHPTDR